MRMYDLIEKKKAGEALTKEEIRYIVREFTEDRIPEYQMAAMLMAICFKGMTDEEMTELTLSMASSGKWRICQPSRGSRWTSTAPEAWGTRPR